MLRKIVVRFAAVLGLCGPLAACGQDQRQLASDSHGEGDGDGHGPIGGDGDGSSGTLELVQQLHIEPFENEQAGASCGVQVGDSLLVVTSLGDDNYVTRTTLPFDDSVVSEVTEFVTGTDAPMASCEAHLAGDRFFVLFAAYEEPSDPPSEFVLPELVFRGFAVDLEGRVIEDDLGAAEEFLDPELVAATGRQGQLGLLGWESADSQEINFKLFEEGQERPSPVFPIAECEVNPVPPTLVATTSGFAAAFVCVSPEEGDRQTAIVLAFIQGQEVEVARYVVSGQTSEFPVALFPQSDGSVIWAYGAAQKDDEMAEVAMIHRLSPTLEFSYVGQIPLPNQGLRLAAHGESGLALIAPGERWGEDRPPDRFFDYCFLGETGIPTEECFYRGGNNLHAFPSGLYALDRDFYSPLIAFTPWDGPDVAARRVLFDARHDVPRALYCSRGQCEVAQQSYSGDPNSFGYMGYSFLSATGIFSDNVGWARHRPLSYSIDGGSYGEVPPLVHGWTGGSVDVLSLWQGVGPLVLSFDREGYTVVSNAPELATFSHDQRLDLWREGDGYRVFGTLFEEPHTGFVNAAGKFESELADVPSWGVIHRCGDRYLNVTTGYELFFSRNDAATQFEMVPAGDASSFTVLGCTDRFLARWARWEEAPLQIVSLESGEVTSVPGFEGGRAPLAGVMGERLALFRLGPADVEMALVDAAGVADLHHLPVPEPFDDGYAPQGWGDKRLIVPQVLDEDMNHVSAIWVAEGGAVYLSSWRFAAEL